MKRDEQQIDLRERLMIGLPVRQFRQQVERQLSLSQVRPDAPRGVRVQNRVLLWDAPQDARGVTHYNIYTDDDTRVVRQIPASQTRCADFLRGRRFYIASVNQSTGAISVKALYDAGSVITIGRFEISILDYGGNGDGVTDNWAAFRAAMAALKAAGGGRLLVPYGRYRITYNASDATRTQTTGVLDFSPWNNGGTWTATGNIEVYFENGAVLFMDNLLPNGYDAQAHAFFARCRWTDADGNHTPNTWSGYAVNYGAIKIVNACVEWTLGSQRGVGDSFRFTGTKTEATAPYDITLENCQAYNAPQVGALFMGCRQVSVKTLYAEDCFADTCHFNACFEGCSVNGVVAKDCGDDTVAVVTYYPDAITLARGLDREEGPFTSPDRTTANNNGIIVNDVQKVGGRANGVRLLGANRAKVTGVSVDAASSVNIGAAVWVGAVKANGTTLAESGLAALGCEVSKVSAKGGTQVGLHIVCLGMTGAEGDEWLRNDVLVRGVHVTESVQVSIYGQATKGFKIDGARTDTTKVDFSACSDYEIDNFDCSNEVVMTGEATSYAALDMDTMPWHNIRIGSLRVRGNRALITDVRGLIAQNIIVTDSPASAFEGIRLSDFYCPNIRIIKANRDGVADLAHIPFRLIPARRCNVDVQIDHDSLTTQNLIEVGGGDAANVGQDIRVNGIIIHEVVGLGGDPWEIQGGAFAPTNFFRKSRCRNIGTWYYVNTDDLPLGIVPELVAEAVDGVRTLKLRDALAVYATGILNGVATALMNAALYAARQIRFLRFGLDEGNAGVIDYGQLQADALSIHGLGTSGSNRRVRIYDLLNVNGTVDAASTITAPDVRVTNTTGGQPAKLDGSNFVKGGKIALTSGVEVTLGAIPAGTLLQASSGGAIEGAGSLTANRVVATIGTGGALSTLAAMTTNNPVVGAGDGTLTSATWTDVYNNIKSAIEADFPSFTWVGLNMYTAAETDTLLGDKLDASVHGSHTHSGTTETASGHTHDFTTGTP